MKILTHVWHIPHQYELFKLVKLGYEIDVLENMKSWQEKIRPRPQGVRFIYEANPNDYDLIILCGDHFVGFPNHSELINTETPKIFLMHGCTINKSTLNRIRRKVRKDILVVNSEFAEKQFKDANFRTKFILHGFDPKEWPQTSYKINAPVNCSPIVAKGCTASTVSNYYGCNIYEKVAKKIKINGIFNCSSFNDYKQKLAQYSIYFNPTRYAPNPRGRAEAMLCGLVPISTKYHNESKYIHHGFSGFLSNDPYELADYIEFLIETPDQTKLMGQRAKKDAIKYFHIDRYLNEWDKLIKEVACQHT